MPLPSSLDHLRDRRIRDLADYWLSRRNGGTMPRRRDIDPVDIPWALSFIWLCDYLPEDRNFRYRLAGEAINEVFGRNVAGKRFHEVLSPKSAPFIRGRYLPVVDEPAIAHSAGAIYRNADRPIVGERIIFPLSKEGDGADMLLGMTVYERGAIHAGHLSSNKALKITFTPLGTL